MLKNILQALLVLVAVGWALNVPVKLGYQFFTEQMLAIALGLSVALVFLDEIRPGWSAAWKWVVRLAALCVLALSIYLAKVFPTVSILIAMKPLGLSLVAGSLVALLLLALLRTSGIGIFIVVVAFISYAILGYLLPGPMALRDYGVRRVMLYLGADPNGVLGAPLKVAISIVLPYILFGRLLTLFGGAEFFTDLASALMARFRGGHAKVAITASALFGTISGSAVGNVVSTGVVTIPLMEKGGYRPKEAGAIEAVASTGGQLVPPVLGATAFLMAEFLALPYSTVVAASIIPCVLYYWALFLQVDLLAGKRRLTAETQIDIPAFWPTLRQGWHFLLPFVAIFVGLFRFNLRAEVAALYAIAVLLAVGLIFGHRGKRPGPKEMAKGIIQTGGASKEILIITASAGIVIGVLNLTGVSFSITQNLVQLTGGNIIAMLLVAALINIILGMGMPTVGIYVLLATLIAPPMISLGIEPIAAHMFILYFGLMSMVTPPVALASFAAAHIAKANPWQTSWMSMRFAWVAYVVPFLFVAAPSLLMIGDTVNIVHATVTALIGVGAVSVGFVGFLMSTVPGVLRPIWVIAGVAAMVPGRAFEHAQLVEAAGIVAILVCLAQQLPMVRRLRTSR
ncbi:C4-dicarboxylate TRAP transporter large permease protein DctM (plasmid) [Antarctobacter heliothermus]|uniref:C4-dicarboxylate TRAP transporter large permease protein DctM n=1 Tax=Antarctobacter heliothermus TaxID=74033 RepID=A0A222EBW4_9RHOB|nr:TRAP transporter fused permease subunit [Antarctobacter heliothermus]ASP23683.1 C4-dicarboxylate TRAP transporter large permease protein DctM [Antarctobacter heliothermus]